MLPVWSCLRWAAPFRVTAVALVCYNTPCFPQTLPEDSGYDIRRISLQNGLRNQIITALCVDQQGLLWIGTQSGLYSFDGFRVTGTDNTRERLLEGFITDLELIRSGSRHLLWVATRGGSCLLDTETRRIVTPEPLGLPDSLMHHLFQVEQYADGSLLALGRRRLFRLRPGNSGTWTVHPSTSITSLNLEKNAIPRLFAGKGRPGMAWLLRHENFIYRATEDRLEGIKIPIAGRKPTPVNGILQFIPAHDGGFAGWDHARNLYLLDDRGQLSKYPDTLQTLTTWLPAVNAIDRFLKQKPVILCYLRLETGQEIFGTSLGLFFLRKKKPGFRVIEQLTGEEIRGILTDSLGNWWAGSYTGFYSGSRFKDQVEKRTDLFTVWDFLHLYGDTWLLGLERPKGALLWNKSTGGVSRLPLRPGKHPGIVPGQILALCRDARGNIWAGTYFDLNWSTPDTPLALQVLKDGARKRPFRASYVRALYADPDSSVWAGTESGLYRIRYDHRAQGFTWDTLLPGVFISGFYADRYDHIWVATKGKGVARYHKPSGRWDWFDTGNGLCHDFACRIEGSHGDQVMWISTHDGLSRLDVRSGLTHNYREEDGFPGNEFNSAASARFPDGSLLFGGVNGLVWFHPDSLHPGNYRYQTLITHLRVYDADMDSLLILPLNGGNIHLPPYPRYVEFLLGSDNFVRPDKTRFRYRLLGASGLWNYTNGESEVKYFQIAPGEYTFEAQAIAASGHLGPPIRIMLHIQTPYYETWLFRALMLAALAALAWVVYRYLLWQARKEQIIRRQIADDLHDDIGNKLNILSILAQKAAREMPQSATPSAIDLTLQKLKHVSRDALRSLHTMIWSVDPGKDRLSNLFSRMQDFAGDYLPPLGIHYVFEAPDPAPDREINPKIRYHIMLIYQELLTNMIKHANPRKIVIQLRRQDSDSLVVSLANEYLPVPEHPAFILSAHRGLASIERRLQQINGKIMESSLTPTGQSITLIFPKIFK